MILARFELSDTNSDRTQRVTWKLCDTQTDADDWLRAQEFEHVDLANDKYGDVKSLGMRGVLYAKPMTYGIDRIGSLTLSQLGSLPISELAKLLAFAASQGQAAARGKVRVKKSVAAQEKPTVARAPSTAPKRALSGPAKRLAPRAKAKLAPTKSR